MSPCGRFAVRWRKIFAGETKPGVNRVQDSAVVIRGKANITGSSCFSVFSLSFSVMLNVTHMFAGQEEKVKTE